MHAFMHGGRRPGAGRKPGVPGGQVMKIRQAARERIISLIECGRDPLDAVLDIAFNMELDVGTRLQAALGALPFVHPRLSSQTIDARSIQAKVNSAEVFAQLESRLNRYVGPVIEVEPAAESAS